MSFSFRQPVHRSDYRLVVDNISSRTSWRVNQHTSLTVVRGFLHLILFFFQELKEYFRKVGDVSYANAHSPRTGEGVIEFFSKRDMEYALDHKVKCFPDRSPPEKCSPFI